MNRVGFRVLAHLWFAFFITAAAVAGCSGETVDGLFDTDRLEDISGDDVTGGDIVGDASTNEENEGDERGALWVSFLAPRADSWLCGEYDVMLDAGADRGVQSVELRLADELLATLDSAPYHYLWDSTQHSDGEHTLSATVHGKRGGSSSASITIELRNSDGDCDNLPVVRITSPADDSAVLGRVTVEAEASDDNGVQMVQFFVDDELAEEVTTPPYRFVWDSSALDEGTYEITALALDTAAQSATDSISLYVDRTPPSISIASPQGGEYSDEMLLHAVVSDNVRVARVEWYFIEDGLDLDVDEETGELLDISGTPFYEMTAEPYQASYGVGGFELGEHALVAIAYDEVGLATVARGSFIKVAEESTEPREDAPTASLKCRVPPGQSAPQTGWLNNLETQPGVRVICSGEDSTDPNGLPISDYIWTIDTPDQGATQQPDTGVETSVLLDTVGTFRVTLVAVNSEGVGSNPISSTLSAVPGGDITFNLTWEHWFGGRTDENNPQTGGCGADLDLHVIPNRGIWYGNPSVFWRVRTQTWSGTTVTMVQDVIRGIGPEITTIETPRTGETYRAGVHVYNDAGFGAAEATLEVIIGGVVMGRYRREMEETNHWWDAAAVGWLDDEPQVHEIDGYYTSMCASPYAASGSCRDQGGTSNLPQCW